MTVYGGIEAGGTKIVCAMGAGPDRIVAETRIPTTAPAETLAAVVDFFRSAQAEHGTCAALGVAAFGPLDLDRHSPTWGRLTATPKPHWSGTDLLAPLREAFDVPLAIDTDVQGAALGEQRWGAGRDCELFVYVTAGTGIGGAALRRGEALHSHLRAEVGHIRCPRHPADTEFPGICPFHGDCLEGLASGPAVQARWGRPLEALAQKHPAWEILGHYFGQLAATLTLAVAPDRILFGGGLFTGDTLLGPTQRWLRQILAGYPVGGASALDDYLQRPALGGRAGVLGALALAERAGLP